MDVRQLADVFEAFRDFSMRNYQLDPAHYVSLPSLSWDAMLKYTGVELELPTDSAIYEFFPECVARGHLRRGETPRHRKQHSDGIYSK